jgi:low affinity Fe/Cu permease
MPDPKNTDFAAWFGQSAAMAASLVGSPWAFLFALLLIIGWGLSGPYFHYSDTWQLIINTGTTILTFLVVFLIQNTQNRDARALHLKLDEIIRSLHAAHNEMIDIEKLSDAELDQLAKRYERFRNEYATRRERGKLRSA